MIGGDLHNKNNNISQYQDRIAKFSSEFELGLFLHLAKRSLIWIILLLTVFLSFAYIYLRYAELVYQSKTIVQINNSDQASKVLNINQISEDQNKIAGAIEIIKSKVFLNRIVKRLNLYVSYFNEGTFKSNELYTSTPFIAEIDIKKPTFYGQKFYVTFKTPTSGNIVLKGKNIKEKVFPFELEKWVTNANFDVRISCNPDLNKEDCFAMIKKQESMYFTKFTEEDITASMQKRLEIKLQNELAKTVSISIKDNNPVKAADIVNSISNEFQQYDVEKESQSSEKVITFINNQLSHVYSELKRSEDTLQEYRRIHNFSINEHQVQSDMARITTLEDQLLKTELEEKILDNIQQDIRGNKSIDSYQLISTIAGTQEENGVREIVSNLQKTLIEKENLLFQAKPGSEEIKRLNFQIENQKNLLIQSLGSLRVKMKSKYQNLKEKSDEYENKYSAQPEKELEYAQLMRFFNINEKYYTLLLEKKTEFAISKAGFVSQTIILEKGVANMIPVSPNKQTTLIAAILSAIVIGLGVIIIRYLMHNEINSLNEITKHMSASLNVLGIIPSYDKEIPVSQLVVDRNPKSLISEAFRTLRTNLQYISNTSGTKIIALTSTVSGEGKTFVAINLAGIIAFSNKKVIILDLDMRKPKIHKGFGITNELGMSTILIGKSTIEECVNKSTLPNLDFITAGPIPPNPSELIISKEMDNILEKLKKQYDIIVIDNPPVGLVTDGVAMIARADYPIYVFRADYSKRNYIQILDRLQNENKVQHLSVVLNGVDINRNTYGYNYGYGYGYGYGKNYGYYEDRSEDRKKGFSLRKKKISIS